MVAIFTSQIGIDLSVGRFPAQHTLFSPSAKITTAARPALVTAAFP